NDPQFIEAARGLGERMLREGGYTPEGRLTLAFRWATSRAPDAHELRLLTDLYSEQIAFFRSEPDGAKKYLHVGERPPPLDLDGADLSAAGVTANAILNLDAATMIR